MEIRFKDWVSLFDASFQFTEHKSFEVQLMWDAKRWLMFELDFWTWSGQDHAGPRLNIALFGFELALSIYDHRHWDDDKNDWEVYT